MRWTISASVAPHVGHPTVKPLSLMRYLLTLVTPPGGTVLDPFGGSGTTAEAAQALGRSAILIDLDERNADLARERVGMFLEVDAA